MVLICPERVRRDREDQMTPGGMATQADQTAQNSRLLQFGCMAFFLVNGALVLLTSSLLVFLMQDYNLTYDQGGLLLTIQAVGNIATSFLSGPLALRIGRKRTLILAALGFSLSLGLVALAPPLWILQLALFLSGLAWGTCNNLVNFIIVQVSGGHSGRISRVHTSFSIGAFLAPLLVALAVRLGISWRWPVALIAVAAAGLVLLAVFLPIPETSAAGERSAPQNKGYLRDWRLYLYMLLLFLYVGIETGFSGWLVTYLTGHRHLDPSVAQSLLSGLWIAMIAGRVLVSVFGHRLNKSRFLLLEAIGAVLAALLLIRASQPVFLALAVFGLGLSLSAFYGMVIANASHLVAESPVASGLIMGLGGLGASLMPLLAGVFAASQGIVAGLWALFTAALCLLALTVVNALFPHR